MADQRTVLVVSIVPVGPRAPSLAKQWFALHLSVGLQGDSPTLTEEQLASLLLPWLWVKPPADMRTWSWPAARSIVVQAMFAGPPGKPTTWSPLTATVESTKVRAPAVVAGKKNTVKGWIGSLREQYECILPPFDRSKVPANAKPFLSDHLAYLATHVGGIPQLLELTQYFQIESPPAGPPLETVPAFVVAPSLEGYELATIAPNGSGSFDWRYERQDHGALGPFAPVVRTLPIMVTYEGGRVRFDGERAQVQVPGLSFDDYWVRCDDGLLLDCKDVTDVGTRFEDLRQLHEDCTDDKDLAAAAALFPQLARAAQAFSQELQRAAALALRDAILTRPKPGHLPESARDHACKWLTAAPETLATLQPGILTKEDVATVLPGWTTYVKRYVTMKFAAEARPSGLLLRLDDDKEEPSGGPLDAWAKIAGVALLVAEVPEAGEPTWRLASSAVLSEPAPKGSPLDNVGIPLLEDATPIPVRMPFAKRKGDDAHVRDATLTYEQRSLVAASPLAVIAANHTMVTDLGSIASPRSAQYRWCPVLADGKNDRMLLTALRYGPDYYCAVGIIDAAGGLATGFSAYGSFPWMLRGDAFEVPLEARVRFRYLRRVGVGHVNLTACGPDRTTPQDWPTLPASVAPLVREIPQLSPINPADGAQSAAARPPLVLTNMNPVHLMVRAPTVAIDVMERWLTKRDQIKQAWQWVLRQRDEMRKREAMRLQRKAPEGELPSPALDEPAVSTCEIHLERWDWPTMQWVPAREPHVLSVPFPKAATPAYAGQRAQVVLECIRGDTPDTFIEQRSMDGIVVITIGNPSPRSNLARVSVHAIVDADVRWRFDPDVLSGVEVGVDVGDGSPRSLRLEAQVFYVEAASMELPSAQELYDALLPPTLDIAHRRVDVNLSAAGILDKLLNVGRVEVLEQAWQWRGRPLPEKGGPEAVDPVWEHEAFTDLDDDLDTLQIPVGYVSARDLLGSDFRGGRALLYSADFSRDPRSHYLRFGLRIFSRYPDVAPIVALAKDGVRFRSVFLPYVGPRPGKPIIHAVVPATRPYSEAGVEQLSDHVAPLLLVIDETAFAACGVAETIKAEIVKDDESGDAEYGPDPILSGNAATAATPQVLVAGPFGYTFDTDARRPLFGASSYLVRLVGDQAKGWDFAKLRFQRSASGSAEPSDWTAPIWVQFLPPETFGVTWDPAHPPPVRLEDGALKITLRGAQDREPQYEGRFVYRLLVTREIYDFGADRVREVRGNEEYVGLLEAEISHSGNDLEIKSTHFQDLSNQRKGPFCVRIIEAQVASGADVRLPEAFWKNLMVVDDSNQDQRDAQYRITRISPRISLGGDSQR